jgi:hypothetical protein
VQKWPLTGRALADDRMNASDASLALAGTKIHAGASGHAAMSERSRAPVWIGDSLTRNDASRSALRVAERQVNTAAAGRMFDSGRSASNMRTAVFGRSATRDAEQLK